MYEHRRWNIHICVHFRMAPWFVGEYNYYSLLKELKAVQVTSLWSELLKLS